MRIVKCTVQVWGKAREWQGEIVFRHPEWREEWLGRWEAVNRELLGQCALVGNPFEVDWSLDSTVIDTDVDCSEPERARLIGLCRTCSFSVAWHRKDSEAAADEAALLEVEGAR